MRIIRSIFVTLLVELQRLQDHLWRYYTGLPQLTRSEISRDLFLGGQYGIRTVHMMKKLGITGIVNMRINTIHDDHFKKEFRILNLPTPDLHAPTLEQLIKGVRFITREVQSGGKVYVHCRHGEGRGPTMAIAYLISLGMTLPDATEQVRKVRTFIKVTPPQQKCLKEFERLMSKK